MADFSQDIASVCVRVYVLMYVFLWAWVCFLFSCFHMSPCVMWALKLNNFRGMIGDRDLKCTCPFPQQPSKEEEKGWSEEGAKNSHLYHSCRYPLLFEAISHWSHVFPLELSMQPLACVTGTSNLSRYCQSITLSSGVNAFIFFPSWWTIGLK